METLDNYSEFKDFINKYNINTLITEDFQSWLKDNGFFSAPASRKYHGAHEGGLWEHSQNVARQLALLTVNNDLKWERKSSPLIIGLFHDICKIDLYQKTEDDTSWEYNKNPLYSGHGDKSLMILASHILLTEEESACIRYHMGAFSPEDEWSMYTRAVRKYPNVLWTHTADMLAAHVIEKN